MARRLAALLAVAVIAAAQAAAPARGDGDPASDVLLLQNVFYPYNPPVAPRLRQALNAETSAAARAHLPIKVALIAGPTDLGAVPDLFNQPQKYANFLDQEISFQARRPLLVVMPAGYGVQGLPPASTAAASSLPRPSGAQPDALAQAAILAVPKLAGAAGRHISTSGAAASGGTGGSHTALIAVILAVAVLALAGGVIAVRLRRRGRVEARSAPGPRHPPPPPPRRRSRRR